MSQVRRQGSDNIFTSLPGSLPASPTARNYPALNSPLTGDLIPRDFLGPRSDGRFGAATASASSPRKPTTSPLHTSGQAQSSYRADSSLSRGSLSQSSSAATSPLDTHSTLSQIAHAAFPAPPSRTSPISISSPQAIKKRTVSGFGQNDKKMTEQPSDMKTRKASDATESSVSASPSPMSPVNLPSIPVDRPGHRAMPRTSSIDSAISSLSSASQPHKSSFDASALSQADIGNLIATAGSAEAVIKHLLKEKHHAASQNSQLWRLVDKQRTLILGLNKDLERAMKEKERYKKKVKELQASVPPLPSMEAQSKQAAAADGVDADSSKISSKEQALQRSQTLESQDSPVDTPSPKTLSIEDHEPQPLISRQELTTASPRSLRSSGSPTIELTSSEKGNPKVPHPVRKPPPAPLNLGQPDHTPIERPEASDSESEYEDILAVDELPIERGRRKTRDDDDREREAALLREEPEIPYVIGPENANPAYGPPPSVRRVPPEPLASALSPRLVHPASLGDHPTVMGPKSPGLPLSPRPEDRPLGSPLPRMPREMPTTLSSVAMPSGNNLSGLALSPRVGKHPNMFAAGVPNSAVVAPASPTRTPMPMDPFNRPIPSIDAAVRMDNPQSSPPNTSGIYQGLMSEEYPNLLLPPNALPLIQVKVSSSRLRPSRNSYMTSRPLEEEPVFTLSVFSRSENAELWRVEKVIAALPQLDQHIRQLCSFPGKLPDRSMFSGHSPAKVDARRAILNSYFETLLDTHMDETAALAICQFLSLDAIEPRDDELTLLKGNSQGGAEVLRGPNGKPRKEGYLTKRGKNFGGWKARFFVLHGPELRYFESPGGAHLGTIKIHNAQIGKQSQNSGGRNTSPSRSEDDTENQYRHAFLILEPKKKDSSALVRHVLCAESDEERDSWVDALLEYVEGPSENESSLKNQAAAAGKQPTNAAAKAKMLSSQGKRGTRGTDSPDLEGSNSVQGFSYDDAAPAEPPILGLPGDRPPPKSPLFPQHMDFSDGGHGVDHGQISSKVISGPTNGAVIQDAGAWGNKTVTSTKEKKRSIWGFRTRSSIDLASQIQNSTDSPAIMIHSPGGERRDLVRPVFGIPLADAVQYCAPLGVDVDLPAVVYRCIEYLKAKGAEMEEGIFRLSGSNVVVKALRERFNTEGDVDFISGDQYYDVHAVASLFKQYLRELPTTVLTRELHIEFLRVLELNEKHKKIIAFNSLVHRLPKPNLSLLRALVQFLIIIVNNSDINKMTVRNVGIVFAPTLNIPAPVFSMFLTDFEGIFEDPASSSAGTVELTVDHSLNPEDIRSPRRQMFSDLPTPAPNQINFPRPGDPPEENSVHHDTGFAPVQPNYEPYNPNASGNYNYPQGSTSRMLAPDNSRAAKAKRRESSMLFMDMNYQGPAPASHDDHA